MSTTTAELAVRLPWLAPGADALIALARDLDPTPAILADPAATLLVLRSGGFPITNETRYTALRFALKRLSEPPVGVVVPPSATTAEAARAEALRVAPDLADHAFIAASICDLGRMAAAAVDTKGSGIISAAETTPDPFLSVTRRLVRRWQLPEWCQACFTSIDDSPLADIVREATTVNQRTMTYRDPYDIPLLPALIEAAAKNFRRKKSGLVRRLELENDRLHAALAQQAKNEEERLRERKIVAIAEFAAGAGHEINTPLAVISGQAQYLLAGEEEPTRRKALSTVVHQAHRVHEILTDLMQFARPGKPEPQLLDLSLLARDLMSTFSEPASIKEIRLEADLPDGFLGCADPKQLRTALHCLVRNALEHAPAGGWIRLRGDGTAMNEIRLVVEDSGPGVDPDAIIHLFDPFYSGRPAGRGRGLGLPTAWRLARLAGGDVRHLPGSPTAFILALPRAESFPVSGRLSA